ncbi:MAG: hypothetical protein ACQUHE_10360 [Bacteroidia bacterium]
MKKILFLALVLASSLMSYAQKADTVKNSIQKNAEAIGHGGNNELKINLLFTVLGMPEISYERLLADNMGIGASVFVGLDDSQDYKFGFIPHYRIYFGAKKASGFFIEGNASLITSRDYSSIYYGSSSYYGYYGSVERNITTFGLGAAAGGKFLTRNGFLGEAYLGVGRSIGEHASDLEAYPRVGITIGKRF